MRVPPASANLSTMAALAASSAPWPQPVPKFPAPSASADTRRPLLRPNVRWSMCMDKSLGAEFISQYPGGWRHQARRRHAQYAGSVAPSTRLRRCFACGGGCRVVSMSEIHAAPLNWGDLGVSELLPTGTVTLLLADVEGSTRLWETQPDEMTAAFAGLDRTLVEVVTAYH